MNVFSMSQLLSGHTYTKKLHVVYLKFKFNCVLYFLCALTHKKYVSYIGIHFVMNEFPMAYIGIHSMLET